jgi:hypothetical protein
MLQPCVAALRCAIAEAAHHDISAAQMEMLARESDMLRQTAEAAKKASDEAERADKELKLIQKQTMERHNKAQLDAWDLAIKQGAEAHKIAQKEFELEWRTAVKERVDDAFSRNSGCVLERVLIPNANGEMPLPIPHVATRCLSRLVAEKKHPMAIVVTPYMMRVQARFHAGGGRGPDYSLAEFPSVRAQIGKTMLLSMPTSLCSCVPRSVLSPSTIRL